MAIVLQKADLSLISRLSIIDTIELYVNDVLVASASESNGIQWIVTIVEDQSFLNENAYAVINLAPGESIDTSPDNLMQLIPYISEGPLGGGSAGASVTVEDVTLYIPAESIDTRPNYGAASAPVPYISEAMNQASTLSASVTSINLAASVGTISYAPTITEGPSGSASAGANASVTLV